MNDIPVARRLGLAVVGVLVAGFLLRPQMSEALVVRGDERLYRGSTAAALAYYRRAIEADSSDGAAVDRFAFGALSLRDRALVEESIGLASDYLRRRPDDDAVRLDRAMALRLAGDWRRAADDFERAGSRTRDAVALSFAGYAALASHQRTRAMALWKKALRLNPKCIAARHALQRRIAEL